MATNRIYRNHDRIPMVASGTIASGAIVVQSSFLGIADTAATVGKTFTLLLSGIFDLTVPSGTVVGDALYVPGSPPTTSVGATLTKTAGSNTLFGRAVTARDSTTGRAWVLLAAQDAARAA